MKRTVAIILTLAIAAGATAFIGGFKPTAAIANAHPNPADIGFAQDMAIHHSQAVELSELATKLGSPEIQAWGARIGSAQAQEIGRFYGWLDIWDEAQVSANPMDWMHADSDHHNHRGHHDQHGNHADTDITVAMGMATPEDMNRLRALTGEAFDVLFLQLMIRHHQGGVLMAQAGIDKAATLLVRNMCRVIAAVQSKEIFDMGILLRAKGGEPLPYAMHVAANTPQH